MSETKEKAATKAAPKTVTLHAPKHHNVLHVGEHELMVKDGKVEVPPEHVEEAKAFGFSENPHDHIKAEHASDRMSKLETRVAALEDKLAQKAR